MPVTNEQLQATARGFEGRPLKQMQQDHRIAMESTHAQIFKLYARTVPGS